MTPERIAELRSLEGEQTVKRECLDEIEWLQSEIVALKESRAVAVEQEQLNRVGWNNARTEIERLDNITKIQQEQIKRLITARDAEMVKVAELKEALAHYKNSPPPHPPKKGQT